MRPEMPDPHKYELCDIPSCYGPSTAHCWKCGREEAYAVHGNPSSLPSQQTPQNQDRIGIVRPTE